MFTYFNPLSDNTGCVPTVALDKNSHNTEMTFVSSAGIFIKTLSTELTLLGHLILVTIMDQL